MAELPDLTVFSQILTRKFQGKELLRLDVSVAKKLNVAVAELKKTLEGKTLRSVAREGKTLQFHFSGGQTLGLHLMLQGELVEIDQKEEPRFQILAFHFEKGRGFAVIDLQKQATATLQPAPVKVPDALAIAKAEFLALLSRKRTVIKTLLMDQKLLRGVGNSYSDEILYHAHISPFSVAKSIPPKAADRLYRSISHVLVHAIEAIAGANGDELTGELKDFLIVHGAKIKETPKREPIRSGKIGGRTTYYTDAQELFI